MSREWTLDEFAMEFWSALPRYQFETNLKWLRQVIGALSIGGLWGWEERKMILKKVDDDRIQLYKPEE
jgi:hypothetical protein